MATSDAPPQPTARSTKPRTPSAHPAVVDAKLRLGFAMSVAEALKMVSDKNLAPYVKIRVMEFFAKHRPVEPTDDSPEASTRDLLLQLMDDMSALNDTEGIPDDAAPAS